MSCHNQQMSNVNTSQEHPMKQVRFANSSSSSNVAAVLSTSEAGDASRRQSVNQASLGPQLKLLPLNDQIRELQTIIRDKTTSRGDFVFCADRLIRLVVEEGLNQLPYSECTVTTPTGYKYEGVKFERGNCGVSIMRSGEAMEQGLRDCCRSIRIGKILIQSDEETQKAKVYYAKFPPDIYRRKVLLMYPILSTGNTVIEAVKVLIEHGVQPKHIILLSLFSTPHGAKSIIQEFPDITILATEVHPVAPTHFGQRYFGTD
ncbi:uracil phosphoribosyltransferase homolog [Phycodurus eques]|uniref:uracil phosphoribosyltransferase homolog n=1 Tax=Phycodurus eques TaxID=693459 RepID=UPI002ACE4BE1|nr:uracil phosphoribosyltransferase homolog [Phycodurus eques]XP_061542755.1 uracil phosphoribosyltransferase homolog [Phycodurus eques]